MARLESVRVAGYYAADDSAVDLFQQMLIFPVRNPERRWSSGNESTHLVDPCAGEGRAILQLRGLKLDNTPERRVYGVELEATRAATFKDGEHCPYGYVEHWRDQIVHGDFFHLYTGDQRAEGGGASMLWLNPPYDTDRDFKRLEERWLQRATPLLSYGGLLAFVVPHYALAASAHTIAMNYRDVACYRFPNNAWGAYKQVILVGHRCLAMDTRFVDATVVARIQSWAQDAFTAPTLDDAVADGVTYAVPPARGFSTWELAPLDLSRLAEDYDPWIADRGPVIGHTPPDDPLAVFSRRYPVASRPRAAHISAALAAGVFNGVRVVPDDVNSTLPPLLVKGVFDKEYKTIDTKTNKDGEVVAEVQVQQPRLTVTVLDLTTGLFHTVAGADKPSTAVGVDTLTMRDLLEHYGHALMHAMLDACPVLHDPDNDPDPIVLPETARTPFPAQADAIRTTLKLLHQRPDRGVLILGEIGVGKTTVALIAARACHARRILVLTPPHLLKSWADQVKAVLPDARVMVLGTIPDVRAFASCDDEGVVIALLSRERAKLGHGWVEVSGSRCPGCGGQINRSRNLAKTRARCEVKTYRARNDWAKWCEAWLPLLMPYIPQHRAMGVVSLRRVLALRLKMIGEARESPFQDANVRAAIGAAVRILGCDPDDTTGRVLASLCMPRYAFSLAQSVKSSGWDPNSIRGEILNVLEPGSTHVRLARMLFALSAYESTYRSDTTYTSWVAKHSALYAGQAQDGWSHRTGKHQTVRVVDGALQVDGVEAETTAALAALVDHIVSRASWKSKKCGEQLFQATGPVRYPLARYLKQHAPDCYDFLIADEVQEFGSRDSAQTDAAQRLFQTKAPRLALTGSLVNGYAESVFMNMYALSPEFASLFGRDGIVPFIDRYGYWKRVVEDKDRDGKIIEFGSQSSRVIRGARKVGPAPGVLPVFQLEHLLPMAVTLQKEDLRMGIPPHTEERIDIEAEGDLLGNYTCLLKALKAEIKASRFIAGRAGKLWGALARLPSYLDLAAVGNTDDGTFEIRWPDDTEDVGGQLVASVPILDPSITQAKEQWMLDRIQAEVDAGRNVMVIPWHTRLATRATRLVRDAGFRVVHLDPSKVATGVREAWIDKHVIKAKAQVLVVNPVAVQTGLNNLVWFSTQIWLENPGCNAIVYRQAGGRIDRIGQTEPSHLVMPVYGNTAQDAQHKLLLHKVAVSKGVDGLDPEEALRAAGILEQDEFSGLSVGKALYQMIVGGED